MTINSYMNLKTISGTKVIALKAIQRVMQDKYNEISNRIKVISINTLKNDENIVRLVIQVPSESYKEIMYTVVIDFFTNAKKISGNTHINIYSNSPAFQFTFTYVYDKHNLLIEDYKKYSNKKALRDRPKFTNPKEILGFEKSVVYALIYTQKHLKNKIASGTNFHKEPRKIPTTDMIVEHQKTLTKINTNSGNFKF